MRGYIPLLALVGFVLAVGGALAETMYARTSTKVLEEKRLGAPVVATLEQGDAVGVIERSGAHYQVSVAGKKGWVYYNKLAQEKPEDVAALLARRPGTMVIRQDEVSAGGALRGLSPMAENYAEAADLPPWARQAVEDMQAREFTAEQLEAFAREGGLGEFGEGQ